MENGKKNTLHPVIEYRGKEASSNSDKSNMFASFFQTVYVNHPIKWMNKTH